jgi:NAD(P)H-hydrate epimerase
MFDPNGELLLLGVEEMYRADKGAVDAGISGETLMEAAGQGLFDVASAVLERGPVAVLAGPGNNGGDGFVVARRLREAGWPVRLGLLGDPAKLAGDAAVAAEKWRAAGGDIAGLDDVVLDDVELIVDAVFGAGLSRPVEGVPAEVLGRAGASGAFILAADVPSGVHGDTGAALGVVCPADATVTFCRRKPGHLLQPGRALCGGVHLVDIGTPAAVIAGLGAQAWENAPPLWREALAEPAAQAHKYSRGYVVTGCGDLMTGAARLAAAGARRAGAGMVSVLAPRAVLPALQAAEPGLVLRDLDDAAACAATIEDERVGAFVIGPGRAPDEATRELVRAFCVTGRPVVLDAGALTAFSGRAAEFFDILTTACVLTPHAGEFVRLFKTAEDRLAATRAAAREAGCVVVLKGNDTVVAAPDGRAAINANAPATLATAGAGDVLAGIIAAHLAAGMSAFEAAAAAVWLHGGAASLFGPGLIAEDLPDLVPEARAAAWAE